MAIKKLVENKVLRFAKNPENNPNSLDFPSYTLSFIEDDYPAKTPVMWNAIYQKFNFSSVANIMLVGDTKDIPVVLKRIN